jgi:Na+-transporting methylmalonyl-CoA/oxaloacetate decarboxylase gamma subunit
LDFSALLGVAGVTISFLSILIAAMTAKHAVRRDTIHDLVKRIETLEADLAECEKKHRAAEEKNVMLMERLVELRCAIGD